MTLTTPEALFVSLADLAFALPSDPPTGKDSIDFRMDRVCVRLFDAIEAGAPAPSGFHSRWESDERATEYYQNWLRRICSASAALTR